nr:hypothetical protein BaRGS_016064 [Batillaria attramentaria]
MARGGDTFPAPRSGNDDEEKPSDFAKAVDDAIELAGGQEEPQKKKIKIDQATIDIREAAMDTENQRKVALIDFAKKLAEDPKVLDSLSMNRTEEIEAKRLELAD